MKTKRIKISDVKIGMKIKTFENGNITFKEITDKFISKVKQIDQVCLTFENGSIINCSTNHPIMCLENSEIIQKYPRELTINDIVITDLGFTRLLTIDIGQENNEEYIDITVKDTHTFFTSESINGNMILTHNSQGGIRDASVTLYAPIWHLEIEDILVLKNNKGTNESRVRRLDYGIQWDTYLIRRAIKKQDITLFSPGEVPDLYEAFFNKDRSVFELLYEKYENDPTIKYKKVVNGRELLVIFLKEAQETGRIYSFMADHVNTHTPFKKPIYLSNLCCEIALPTEPVVNKFNQIDDIHGTVNFDGLIQLCTLAAINLGNLNLNDPSEMERRTKLLVRFLNEILDYQDYQAPQAKNATMTYRPLGIGIINYAYFLAKNGVKYNDEESFNLTHRLGEQLYYYSLKASVDLAKERGSLPGIKDTIYSDGSLLIDTYNKGVDEITKEKLHLDWESLRKDVNEYGVYNSTLTALMPSESCLKWNHEIKTNKGWFNFHQLLERSNIDWEKIESENLIGWYNINPIQVYSGNEIIETDKIYFNGNKKTVKLTLNDGQEINATINHKFLVKINDNTASWKKVHELLIDDEILEINDNIDAFTINNNFEGYQCENTEEYFKFTDFIFNEE